MTNYQSAVKRIKKCSTSLQVLKLNKSLTKLFECGQLSETEFKKLDSLLLDKLITFEK